MEQCLARTKAGSRCKRAATENCYGYCRIHFNALPRGSARSSLRRAKAKSILKSSMEVISTGIGIVELVNAIIKFVGQFLSHREHQYFKLVQHGRTLEERVEAASHLTNCLSRNRGKRTVTRRLGIES